MNLVRRPTPLGAYRARALEDPFGRLVENMFEDMLAPMAGGSMMPQWANEGITTPRLNVKETEKSFEVEAEMPGVKKEDVKVSIENQRVTVEAETKTESEQREGENIIYSERSTRKYLRAFTLPSDVDEAAAQAHLENGVLTLSLPKKQGGSATKLTVQ
ncbi:Hsp20/alpha crystallin family protein [Massilia cavernae]|uniref:Hsp20/alpha crystallin family protein n=1 Tax=Massilia cavernae TaxID=2320864 RepID=A0A418Y870_9BURK|nr:Hsp20/alpha crystallin family protein [Massilia cavernae]RJG27443.1 Hsp20/alpha crystallin family protein [Massilia cavernae]